MDSPSRITARPRASHRNPLSRYVPKSLSTDARWRFTRTRRDDYLRRIGGESNERQSLIIIGMIEAEWNAIVCERKAGESEGKEAIAALRVSAEWRRQLALLDRDLDQATRARQAAEKPVKAKPGVPQLDLEQHMAKLRERREGAS